jgi:exodeoxyribonuclease VII large subunit
MAEISPILTVSGLNRLVRQQLETHFAALWVEGELSSLARPASGHLYFNLKDAQAQVRCTFFKPLNQRCKVKLQDGLQVRVRARYATLYEGRGDYQLQIEHLELAGAGELQLALEQLKQKLTAEGLFAKERKRPLPPFPLTIGIISSPSGAALADILNILQRRWASRIILYPIVVQGQEAAPSILKMLALANQRRECEVLILARGGGSSEDLWAFNTEAVVRAVAASDLPIVTGVGHEIDFTLVDFAADLRAPTPSAAAELVSPNRDEWLPRLQRYSTQLHHALRQRLILARTRWQALAQRLRAQQPERRLVQHAQRLDELSLRLTAAQQRLLWLRTQRLNQLTQRLQPHTLSRRLLLAQGRLQQVEQALHQRLYATLEHHNQRLAHHTQALQMLSPLAVLARGYTILQRAEDGAVLRSNTQVTPGQLVNAQLAQGRLTLSVTATQA